MIKAAGAALLMLVAMGNGDEQARPPGQPPAQGFIFHQQVIIRVTPMPRQGANRIISNGQNIEWRESGGPRCIPVRAILGAAQITQDSIDLVLRDATRIRARLERHCPALDYYNGFYLAATADGLICADRDSIRSRTGGQCQIDRFRSLRAGRSR